MGICYSIDHIAEAHIHIDIICNTEEPQQKYRIGTVSNRLLGVGWGLNYFTGSKPLPVASAFLQGADSSLFLTCC